MASEARPRGVEDPKHAEKLHAREPGDPAVARRKWAGREEKAMSHKSSMDGGGESSDRIVPTKCANKGGGPSAERMEGRQSAKEIPEHWADAGHCTRKRRQLQFFGSACGPTRTGRAYLQGGNSVR